MIGERLKMINSIVKGGRTSSAETAWSMSPISTLSLIGENAKLIMASKRYSIKLHVIDHSDL